MYTPASGFYPYLIDQSLRFNDDDGPNLTQTYGGSGTSTALGTFSWWMKLGNVPSKSQENIYFESTGAGGIQLRSGKLATNGFDSSNTQVIVQTDALLRDSSSWYHCVVSVDGTAGTIKFYINGVEQAQTVSVGSLVAGRSWDMLGYDSRTSFTISNSNSANSFDGYLAEFHYIDGTALDATSFGETINGIWVPKQYSGSYGTNGFYLSFADSAAIGDDLSGNTNDWTANNLAASDVVLDSPTNVFPTINLLDPTITTSAISEANLKITEVGNNLGGKASFAVPATGKWYWECYCFADLAQEMWNGITGITTNSSGDGRGGSSNSNTYGASWSNYSGSNYYIRKFIAGVESAESGSFGTTKHTVLGIAIDRDANEAKFYKDNALQFTTSISATQEYFPAGGMGGGTNATTIQVWNFGQDSTFAGNKTAGGNADGNGVGDFFYAPPSGFLALCSANLDEPAIGPNSTTTSDQNFNTLLYTGDGTTSRSITGVGFAPDFVWGKCRSNAEDHILSDTVRGANKKLESNNTGVEDTSTAATLSGFESDGFTGPSSAPGNINVSGRTYVAWNWKAGGTAVSNTDGSITSSVSAAPDAGFSIVTWTGNGTDGATIGHGLTSPEFSIVKNRDATTNWDVCWADFSGGTSLNLDDTTAEFSPTQGYQTLGASTITLNNGGSGVTRVNTNTQDYVAYVFKSVEGYSKVGSYEGNSSGTNGPFVFTGFAPSFVMGKAIDQTGRWWMYDSARSPQMNYSIGTGAYLAANLTNVEAADSGVNAIQLLSNGFKVNTTNGEWNGSGLTYIYLAFAEAPFKYANAR
jgi:hypothetical protein